MPLNPYDRDRLLVAVHDGLDAVIGDRVRWKPPGKLSMRQAMAKAGGAKPLVAARKERRLKQARGSRKMTLAREKHYAKSPEWHGIGKRGTGGQHGFRPNRKRPLTPPIPTHSKTSELRHSLLDKPHLRKRLLAKRS